jgi:DNA polymerase-3 subunit epsilon
VSADRRWHRRGRVFLQPEERARLARLHDPGAMLARWRAGRERLGQARFVVLDLETTGPRRDRDRIIALGAVAVERRALVHGDACEAVFRQAVASSSSNILVHRIGAERQLSGADPASALLSFLEYRGLASGVAFRSEFDALVLERELLRVLGLRQKVSLLDLAVLLPALYPGTGHDTLDAWTRHFRIEPLARHDAIGDAYVTAQLLLVALAAAECAGARTVADLWAIERGQRWLGRRR